MPEITLKRSRKISKNDNSVGYEIEISGQSYENIVCEMDKMIQNEEIRLGLILMVDEESTSQAPIQDQPKPKPKPKATGTGYCIDCSSKIQYNANHEKKWKTRCTPCFINFKNSQGG